MNPATMSRTSQFYIGGSWTEPSTDETIDVINASTEEVMGQIPSGGAADVDAAVDAARAALGFLLLRRWWSFSTCQGRPSVGHESEVGGSAREEHDHSCRVQRGADQFDL